MKKHYFLLLIICFFCFNVHAQSSKKFVVSSTIIDQSTSGKDLIKLNFKESDQDVLNFEIGEWVGIKLDVHPHFATKGNFIYIPYSLLDLVELWILDENNNPQKLIETGQSYNFNTRAIEKSDFIFPIVEDVESYYLRIHSSKPIVLPFEILTNKDLIEALTTKDKLFGIYIGLMLVMFFYNLSLFIIVRDKTYLYYILYIITLLTAQLALFGYTDRFLFPNSPEINHKFAVLSGAIAGIFTVFFINDFLKLGQKAPIFSKLLFLVLILETIGIFFLFAGFENFAFFWVNFTSLYGSVIAIIVATKLTRTGSKQAKFFLLAWSVFLLSVVILVFMSIGLLSYSPFLKGSIIIGSSFEVVLLSIALADRINEMRREKIYSQDKALEMSQENQRIIKEQNKTLEQMVLLRTKELQKSNKELKITLQNLKETQSQLVQTEKMASLGVLTAGVAHELNNPLNYIQGGYSAILEHVNENQKKSPNKELFEYLQWIKTGTDRATKIVRSLNVYGKNQNDFEENVNVHKLTNDCLLILKHKLKDSIKIEKDFSDHARIIKMNRKKIHQILLNLIDNAIDSIKFEGEIKISTELKKNNIWLIVKDNGQGISEENLSKVFDPFFTTKPQGKGTGLGLSTVNSIVNECGGKVKIETEVNKGTIISIILPK